MEGETPVGKKTTVTLYSDVKSIKKKNKNKKRKTKTKQNWVRAGSEPAT